MPTASQAPQTTDAEAWLSKIYEIAWQQYSHEDNLGQIRNSVFMAANAALVTVLAAVSPLLAALTPITLSGHKVYIGLAILGTLAVLAGILSIGITSHWRSATEAGRAYVSLRHATARAVEEHVNLPFITLAQTEHQWKLFSMSSTPGDFIPFPALPAMADVKVKKRPNVSGWESILGTARIISAIGYIMCASGSLLLIAVFLLAEFGK
ncbi:hypothetical protein ACH4ZU_11365 [Streptomyces sp. NPDC020472]|uniref:hypothetical protein n=1 Tax=Streptomyces sp. NPDC020472 TaxID=3365075 RepID=UPI0037A324E8